MNILILSDLPQFVTGGAEMQAHRLANSWLDCGHNVRVLGRRIGAKEVRIGTHTVETKRIFTIYNLGRLVRGTTFVISLCLMLLRERTWADVVYTRFLGEAAFSASLMKRFGLLKAVVVATPANTYGKGEAGVLSALPFSRTIISHLDKYCDQINLIAPAMADELKSCGFTGRNFSSVPNGIQINQLDIGDRTKVRRAVFVGRLSAQKGLDSLITAVGRVRECVPVNGISIVGDGELLDSLQFKASQLDVADRFVWHGELDQNGVQEILNKSSFFVLPSVYEGLSNAGLEALERALPIIASRCGGLDTYVDSTFGWTFERGDTDALSCALKAAFCAPAEIIIEMGMRARFIAISRFSMESVSREYLGNFRTLLQHA